MVPPRRCPAPWVDASPGPHPRSGPRAARRRAVRLPGALRLIRDIANALAEPVPVRGQAVTIAASIGLATSHTGADEAEDLLRVADAAMRDAKRGVRALRAVTAG